MRTNPRSIGESSAFYFAVVHHCEPGQPSMGRGKLSIDEKDEQEPWQSAAKQCEPKATVRFVSSSNFNGE